MSLDIPWPLVVKYERFNRCSRLAHWKIRRRAAIRYWYAVSDTAWACQRQTVNCTSPPVPHPGPSDCRYDHLSV